MISMPSQNEGIANPDTATTRIEWSIQLSR